MPFTADNQQGHSAECQKNIHKMNLVYIENFDVTMKRVE